jgi:hypothetical protein
MHDSSHVCEDNSIGRNMMREYLVFVIAMLFVLLMFDGVFDSKPPHVSRQPTQQDRAIFDTEQELRHDPSVNQPW